MNTDLLTLAETNGIPPKISASDSTEWMFNAILPFIKGRALEVGSGVSPFHSLFIKNERPLHLSDADQNRVIALRDKYKDNQTVRAVHILDLPNLDLQQIDDRLPGAFDSIFDLCNDMSVNPNQIAIANARQLLKERGRLIILTSVRIYLYNEPSQHDLTKINRSSIQSMLGKGFEIITARYFNLLKEADVSIPACTGLSAIVIARKIQEESVSNSAIDGHHNTE
jgi:SAM-dependent methyltransferase